jgi:hypothetical protein
MRLHPSNLGESAERAQWLRDVSNWYERVHWLLKWQIGKDLMGTLRGQLE